METRQYRGNNANRILPGANTISLERKGKEKILRLRGQSMPSDVGDVPINVFLGTGFRSGAAKLARQEIREITEA